MEEIMTSKKQVEVDARGQYAPSQSDPRSEGVANAIPTKVVGCDDATLYKSEKKLSPIPVSTSARRPTSGTDVMDQIDLSADMAQVTKELPDAVLQRSGLVNASSLEGGITRKPGRKGFLYYDAAGNRIRDPNNSLGSRPWPSRSPTRAW
jgi:hypothetical protein